MNIKTITKIVTFAVIPLIILGILGFDIFAIAKGGTEASISSLIITFAYEFPLFTFMVGFISGVLVGHLFWRMKSNKDTRKIDGIHLVKDE